MMKQLLKPIKITVCSDGFVSIMTTKSKAIPRRLNAGLPVHSVDTIQEAVDLISKTCLLAPCLHGGKTGTTIEPRVPNWPRESSIDDLNKFSKEIQKMEKESTHE